MKFFKTILINSQLMKYNHFLNLFNDFQFFDNHILTTFQIAEAAKLKPLELELKKLEDLSDAIVQDFALMRKREEEMRDTNGEHHS